MVVHLTTFKLLLNFCPSNTLISLCLLLLILNWHSGQAAYENWVITVKTGISHGIRFQNISLAEGKMKRQMPECIPLDLYWQGFSRRLLQSFSVWCFEFDPKMALGYSLWCERKDTKGLITFLMLYVALEIITGPGNCPQWLFLYTAIVPPHMNCKRECMKKSTFK